MTLMELRRKLPAELLKGHRRRAWRRQSVVFKLHKSQRLSVMLGMCILKSLSLVGNRSWPISQRKEVRSDGRPGVV